MTWFCAYVARDKTHMEKPRESADLLNALWIVMIPRHFESPEN
jgi:hypothetical protein